MRRPKASLLALHALVALLVSAGAFGAEGFERALALVSEKRYAQAREALDPLLAREPDHYRARLLDGILLTRAGRLDEAEGVFEALRRDHPDTSEPHINLAVLHALRDRLDDAQTILLAEVERRPDEVAYANLGDVYTRLARRAYRRAREFELIRASSRGASPDVAASAGAPDQPARTEPPPRDGAADDSPRQVAEVASEANSFCTSAAGFENRSAVAEAALWLQSHGAEVLEVRHEKRQVAGSYRVYLPPLASRKAAEAKLGELRARGLRDVLIIGTGALANGISLGKYRKVENVHRRIAALGRIGYRVRSRAEDLTIVEEYVVRARTDGAPADLNAAWAKRFPARSMRSVDCG